MRVRVEHSIAGVKIGRIAKDQFRNFADGLSDAVMAQLRECRRPASMQDDERLVYDYCVQLTLNHQVPDALWRESVTVMGEQAVVDLTVLSGTYVMVAMLLNATEIDIPGGGAAPLPVFEPDEIRRRLLA